MFVLHPPEYGLDPVTHFKHMEYSKSEGTSLLRSGGFRLACPFLLTLREASYHLWAALWQGIKGASTEAWEELRPSVQQPARNCSLRTAAWKWVLPKSSLEMTTGRYPAPLGSDSRPKEAVESTSIVWSHWVTHQYIDFKYRLMKFLNKRGCLTRTMLGNKRYFHKTHTRAPILTSARTERCKLLAARTNVSFPPCLRHGGGSERRGVWCWQVALMRAVLFLCPHWRSLSHFYF